MASTSCTDVGPGDYVKIGKEWKRIESNTAYGVDHSPRNWTVKTEDGQSYDMWSINAYAKQSEFPRP